jgi:hypothetical protein
MEEMPHNDAAGFFLAVPWYYMSKEGSQWAPLRRKNDDKHLPALIWADLWREGPISAKRGSDKSILTHNSSRATFLL